jgi:hypothetical protein
LHIVAPIPAVPESPFDLDRLERVGVVNLITSLITTIDRPFNIGLAAPWGSGKTSLLNILSAQIQAAKLPLAVCRFDAWAHEDVADPVLGLATELAKAIQGFAPSGPLSKVRKMLVGRAVEVVSHVSSIGLITSAALLGQSTPEAGVIGVGTLAAAKAAEHLAKQLPKAAAKQQAIAAADISKSRAAFRKELSNAVEAVRTELVGGGCKILILVDELDRCKPDFALKILERVKHFFDVPGVVFLFAYDPQYVMSAAEAVYGPRFESERYFRRFVDVELTLPEASLGSFVHQTFVDLDFDGMPSVRGISDYEEMLLSIISCTRPAMSLRDIQHYMGTLRFALASYANVRHIALTLLPALMVTRYIDPVLYKNALRHDGPFAPLLKALTKCMEISTRGEYVDLLNATAEFIDTPYPTYQQHRNANRNVFTDVQRRAFDSLPSMAHAGKWIGSSLGATLRLAAPSVAKS